MVNFILQEAHEKANEIRVKVCNSFSSFNKNNDHGGGVEWMTIWTILGSIKDDSWRQ
jgi:hypothetical protein